MPKSTGPQLMFSCNQRFRLMESPGHVSRASVTFFQSLNYLFTAGCWLSLESSKVYKNPEPTIPVTNCYARRTGTSRETIRLKGGAHEETLRPC
jgi:hypothetical protein